MKTKYTYSTIRFVTNPASGEFVNIGAIVGSDETGEWELRTVENLKRARQIDDHKVFHKVLSVINDVASRIDEYVDSIEELLPIDYIINEQWLRCFYEDNQNILQLSTPTPMLADGLDHALGMVFDELVVDPTKRTRGQTKQTAISAIKRAYSSHHINFGNNLIEATKVHTPSATSTGRRNTCAKSLCRCFKF